MACSASAHLIVPLVANAPLAVQKCVPANLVVVKAANAGANRAAKVRNWIDFMNNWMELGIYK